MQDIPEIHSKIEKYLRIATTFGLFQALMPIGGWLIGFLIKDIMASISMWVSFSVFLFLGIKTLYDSFKKDRSCHPVSCNCENYACLISLAIATSIDAFLIGLVLSLYAIPLYVLLPTIGMITFIMSMIGCYLGTKANMNKVNRGDMIVNKVIPPTIVMTCLINWASVVVKVSCNNAISAEILLLSSPTLRVEKKAMGNLIR